MINTWRPPGFRRESDLEAEEVEGRFTTPLQSAIIDFHESLQTSDTVAKLNTMARLLLQSLVLDEITTTQAAEAQITFEKLVDEGKL